MGFGGGRPPVSGYRTPAVVLPAAGQAQQCSLRADLPAEVSVSTDDRDPQLQVAAVAAGGVGVFSGEGRQASPDLVLPWGCHS